MTFIEIGVAEGGSLQLWKRHLGPFAQIVGIDVNPACKAVEEDQIAIRIGDEGDVDFLRRIVDEFGPPDVVLDDGSHKMHHISTSFGFLCPRLSKNGVYMVEDLHTAYWDEYGGGLGRAEARHLCVPTAHKSLRAHHFSLAFKREPPDANRHLHAGQA